MNRFHRKCGDRVTLLNHSLTAIRNFVEFNHGLILSEDPLADDALFEVRIDRKVNVWNGSLEIGVTTIDPEFMELPATATKLRDTAWILSGNSIVKDGVTIVNTYGPELDTLREGDSVGVTRTNKGELMFFINGRCLGIAARDLPETVWAVIDLYGQCVQVSIIYGNYTRTMTEGFGQMQEYEHMQEVVCGEPTPGTSTSQEPTISYIPMPISCPLVSQDHLRFHPRCGILVKLSANNKTAERARPLDDYNNGVVMTHRPLYDNELFEIRIDRLVDKWSGSIEVGVTTHNPATIRFPSTMTNMDSGTIMMSGCKVLLNGHGTCMEYGNFNLDELREGDTVGMMRKGNGKLHYFINGVDQGVATDKVAQQVWGVIDLYGMTVKVTIVDPCENIDSNMHHMPIRMLTAPDTPSTSSYPRLTMDEETLLFHTLRDSNVIIINDGKTAHRPNAFEHFNNGIVMTNRTLKTNELFQVRLDLVIPKWAGSIEIGVTTHSSNDIQFPFKMSNARSGTWAVTGEDVIRDGYVIIPQYLRNLNRLVEGDTVGVMRKDIGILHFFVNGVDQGPAAFNIPEHVFGIIDLYGRVAQATIVDAYTPPPLYSPESPLSTESTATVFPEMCFHRVHGRNARLNRNRLTASRATVYSEFNDAVLFSSRPLRECDMFEIRIDKMIDCWIGSLEIGVTAIRPEDLEANGGVGAIAITATDLSWDTYILSGAAMIKDGECVRNGYPLDLDTLTVGSRVGMMWHADRSLHYYLDGMDMGKAWYVPHLNIYAVVDLYGQCTQVTILQNEERAFNYNGSNSDHTIISNPRIATPPLPYWSFSEYIGENISLSKDHTMAKRLTPDPMGAIVFSSTHLIVGEIFEIKILECKHGYAGSFRIGVTDVNILNANVNRHLPLSVSWLSHYAAYVDGRYLKNTKPGIDGHDIHSFVPSFEWLRPGDRVALKKTNDAKVIIYYNSEQLELGFEKVPDKVYAIMDMFGHVTKIQTVSRGSNVVAPSQQTIPNDGSRPQAASGETSAIEAPIIDGGDAPKDEGNVEVHAPMMASASVGPNGLEVKSLVGPLPPLTDEEEIAHGEASASADVTADLTADGTADPTADVTADSTADPTSTNEKPQEIEPEPSTSSAPIDARPRQRALPYTFHYMHGKNIKLCSSDTVALRVKGFAEGVAIASQPLRRGQYFRFRVDKLTNEWSGTVCIGAVALLPNDPPPSSALYIDSPCWVVSNDIAYNRGRYSHSELGRPLEDLVENTVLTLHFKLNSELTLDVDGDMRGTIAVIPRIYSHIFPVIDLYGKIVQVSILLHPHILHGVNSLDLPMIAEENQRDEPLAETAVDSESPDIPDEGPSVSQQMYDLPTENEVKTQNQPSLVEEELHSNYARAGPSHANSGPSNLRRDNDARNKEIKCMRAYPFKISLHHSLILTDFQPLVLDNDEAAKAIGIQKSQSTQNFSQQPAEEVNESEDEEEEEGYDSPVNLLSLGSRIGEEDDSVEEQESLCDTNIRQNDQFPEASEVDNLDNEIMDALVLDAANLPDLSDERSPSVDESTRRDDWPEGLALENLVYLNSVVRWEDEAEVGGERRPRFAEREWVFYSETNGNCEHMHLALKFWNHFVLPYPDMREIVASGQVRCYCDNCQPDAEPTFSDWVRIERANVGGDIETEHTFWHVLRSTLVSAQAVLGENAPARRPRSLAPAPTIAPASADIWFDEEGKPHHAVLALDIDASGPGAESDRLLAYMIFLRSHCSIQEPDPLSFED